MLRVYDISALYSYARLGRSVFTAVSPWIAWWSVGGWHFVEDLEAGTQDVTLGHGQAVGEAPFPDPRNKVVVGLWEGERIPDDRLDLPLTTWLTHVASWPNGGCRLGGGRQRLLHVDEGLGVGHLLD